MTKAILTAAGIAAAVPLYLKLLETYENLEQRI